MSELNRREFLGALGAAPLMFRLKAEATTAEGLKAAAQIKLGYAAITWGGNDELAIREVAEAGFRGIQLRATAFDAFHDRPDALKALLDRHRLAFPVLSSGNLKYAPEDRGAQIGLHLWHAQFVRD